MYSYETEILNRLEMLEKEIASMKKETKSDWYTVAGLCKQYHLPRHNIKDRQWRLRNHFPCYQDSVCCRVAFKGSEVEKWMEDNMKKTLPN